MNGVGKHIENEGMSSEQLAKFLMRYGVDITRQGIDREYVEKAKYFKLTKNESGKILFGEKEAQIIAKVRLLKNFLGLKDDTVGTILGVSKIDVIDDKHFTYISAESYESWSNLFHMEFSKYYDHRKKVIIKRLETERERHGNKWFEQVNWLELYEQYNSFYLLAELGLHDLIDRIVDEMYKDNKVFLSDLAYGIFERFNSEVNHRIEQLSAIVDKQIEEMNELGLHSFADSQKVYPEFIKEKFKSENMAYFQILIEKSLNKIYPAGNMSTLLYDEELLATLFLDECNDHVLLMVLGDSMIMAEYKKKAELEGTLSAEAFEAYIHDLRQGLSVKAYNEKYNTYLENNYIKIKACSVYLLNKYLSDTDFKYSLSSIPVAEIKKVAEEKFGLQPPILVKKRPEVIVESKTRRTRARKK